MKCLKCGRERPEEGLDSLKPCPYCGATLQEEIAIADEEDKREDEEEEMDMGIGEDLFGEEE